MSTSHHLRVFAARGAVSSSFLLLRGSILAAVGLSAVGCGGNIDTQGAGLNHGTGSGGSGAQAGAGAHAGEGGAPAVGCQSPTKILQPNGEDSGFVRCANGGVDRVAPATCELVAPACDGSESLTTCATDADCTAAPNGRCTRTWHTGGTGSVVECGCSYLCATDADCADGVCVCVGVADLERPFCLSSGVVGCKGPADCPSGECGLSSLFDGCASVYNKLVCRAPGDACREGADCLPEAKQCASVASADEGPWTCTDTTCTVGRPLLAGGVLRFAPAEPRADWASPGLAPDTALAPEVCAALAASFTEMGAMEHASIGSFARFALELLALGAPPDLLLLTQQAMADETAHAMQAYSLASAYGGRAVGPGALPVAGVVPATDPRAIVRALVREACTGETAAAAEALALSHIVEDPALKAFWARIAEDEGRHAELGWRSLAWMLEGGDPALRDVARDAFALVLAVSARPAPVPAPVVSSAHGLLPPATLAALREQAIRDIVEPCARALLAHAPPSRCPSPPAAEARG